MSLAKTETLISCAVSVSVFLHKASFLMMWLIQLAKFISEL